MSNTVAEPTNPATQAVSTAFPILFGLSFCHMLNDMMQSLLPSMYPMLKGNLGLDYSQIGLITLALQLTASLLQPVVGLYTDKRPMPYSLSVGMASTLIGILLLSQATTFPALLIAAAMVGIGSSIFHPESARMARMASGGRHGLAQSLFQVGGTAGQALGPLIAAFIVLPRGQGSTAYFSGMAMLGMVLLGWIGHHYAGRRRAAAKAKPVRTGPNLTKAQVASGMAILIALVFSKYFYMASLNTFYTFYLIQHFGEGVQHAQTLLFVFMASVAVGTFVGGPMGDWMGRRRLIWFSIIGILPFSLLLPHVGETMTVLLTIPIGLILAAAFPAILVYAQELMPGKIGMVSGLFYGFAFGMSALGAASLGVLADYTSIDFVFSVCAFLPLLGFLAVGLPDIERKQMTTNA